MTAASAFTVGSVLGAIQSHSRGVGGSVAGIGHPWLPWPRSQGTRWRAYPAIRRTVQAPHPQVGATRSSGLGCLALRIHNLWSCFSLPTLPVLLSLRDAGLQLSPRPPPVIAARGSEVAMTKHLSETELDEKLSDPQTHAALRTLVAAFAAWKARAPTVTDFDLEQATALANVIAAVERFAAKQAERGGAYFAMDHFAPALREAWDLWHGAEFNSVAQRSACQTWPRLDPRDVDWRSDPEAAAVIRVQCAWYEYQLAHGLARFELRDDYVRMFFDPSFAKTNKRGMRPDWIPKVVAHLLGAVDMTPDANGGLPLEPAQGRKFREYGARTHWPAHPASDDAESDSADFRLAQMQWARMPHGGDRGAFFGADSNLAERHADAIAQGAIGPMFRSLRFVLTDHGNEWSKWNPGSAIGASAEDRAKLNAALVGPVNAPAAAFVGSSDLTAGTPTTFAAMVTGNAFSGRAPVVTPFEPAPSKFLPPVPDEVEVATRGQSDSQMRATVPLRATASNSNPQAGRALEPAASAPRAPAAPLATRASERRIEIQVEVPTTAATAFRALGDDENLTAELQRTVARKLEAAVANDNPNNARPVESVIVSSPAAAELAAAFCRLSESDQAKILSNPRWASQAARIGRQRRPPR